MYVLYVRGGARSWQDIPRGPLWRLSCTCLVLSKGSWFEFWLAAGQGVGSRSARREKKNNIMNLGHGGVSCKRAPCVVEVVILTVETRV